MLSNRMMSLATLTCGLFLSANLEAQQNAGATVQRLDYSIDVKPLIDEPGVQILKSEARSSEQKGVQKTDPGPRVMNLRAGSVGVQQTDEDIRAQHPDGGLRTHDLGGDRRIQHPDSGVRTQEPDSGIRVQRVDGSVDLQRPEQGPHVQVVGSRAGGSSLLAFEIEGHDFRVGGARAGSMCGFVVGFERAEITLTGGARLLLMPAHVFGLGRANADGAHGVTIGFDGKMLAGRKFLLQAFSLDADRGHRLSALRTLDFSR